MIVPMAEKDLFWIGASYIWDFDNPDQTDAFRESTEQALKLWLKIPFTIVEHRSGLRPATLERRTFCRFPPAASIDRHIKRHGNKRLLSRALLCKAIDR